MHTFYMNADKLFYFPVAKQKKIKSILWIERKMDQRWFLEEQICEELLKPRRKKSGITLIMPCC